VKGSSLKVKLAKILKEKAKAKALKKLSKKDKKSKTPSSSPPKGGASSPMASIQAPPATTATKPKA